MQERGNISGERETHSTHCTVYTLLYLAPFSTRILGKPKKEPSLPSRTNINSILPSRQPNPSANSQHAGSNLGSGLDLDARDLGGRTHLTYGCELGRTCLR
jgi:hypothetical protein